MQYGDIRCMFCDPYQGKYDNWLFNPYGEDTVRRPHVASAHGSVVDEPRYGPWPLEVTNGKGGRYRPMGKGSDYYHQPGGGKGGDRCRVAGFTFCSRHCYWHEPGDCYLYPVHYKFFF